MTASTSPIRLPHFDPRLVPVDRIDVQLPPVPAQTLRPTALAQRFRRPPIWQPELVREPRFADRELVPAAVLVPIVMRGLDEAAPTVLLTERTAHLSSHSGQIAFPGGKVDPGDADAAATALREAREEVGLEGEFVEVLGVLPSYVTGSRFSITPVVALVQPDFELRPNPDEVADAFEVPLSFLMDPANHRHHVFEPAQGQRVEWFSMPYYEPQSAAGDGAPQVVERFIWGATAAMLRNFYRFLSA